jgi:hypothetical protein
MSALTCNDHGLLERSRKVKRAERVRKDRLDKVRSRICSFLAPGVSDSDRRMLAEVFMTEENALLLCEDRLYPHAIGLLRAQQERNACVAASALERLLGEGALVA